MSALFFDLRDSLRGFRRNPLYASATVATLALTLGATTAVFSIVNGVLLRPLSYPDPEQLVSIREVLRRPGHQGQYGSLPVNARHFALWRSRAASFAAMAELDWRTTTLTGAGEPAQVVMLRASGTLFDVLQAPVMLGRPLTIEDEQRDRPTVVVIGHQLWRDRLAQDPNVLGRSLTLGGIPYTIVGVMPAAYELPDFDVLTESASLTSNFDVVIPMRRNLDTMDWMGVFNHPVIARLKPGTSLEQARAELDVLQESVAQIVQQVTSESVDLGGWIPPLEETIVGAARRGLLLLLGAIGGVVLIACSNVSNLALTRTLGRLRESAVRSALGAGAGRLVRQTIVEQLVLALTGGALGIGVAYAALRLFVSTAPIELPRVSEVTIDARVLAFAAVLTTVAGLAVALLPAWRLRRPDVQGMLRGGDRSATDRGGLRARALLLSLQVALSVMLLVVTGLFVTSFVRLARVDPGFSPDRVVAMEIKPIARRYPDVAARAALYDRILVRIRALPSVSAAAWTSKLPLTGETWIDLIARVDDTTPRMQQPSANYRFIGPDYFQALSMPILKGRSIAERDRRSAVTPAVISTRAAETLWPGEDPLGRRFTRADPDQQFEVVGVVADGHPTALDADAPRMVYVPYWFNNEGNSILVVKTAADEGAVLGDLRRAVREVDAEIAIADAGSLQRVVDRALEARQYQMWLFVAFGLVAIAIAVIGVYATTSYGISRRRREMNIRVALGARVSQVFRLVLRQSVVPVAIGLAAGCVGALALGTIVGSLLFQVRANDPLVLMGVIAFVGAVGMLAAAAATKQGLHIDPAAALRED